MTHDDLVERIYLDWAAATPLSETAYAAMEPFLRAHYGNPSSIHQEGLVARRAVDTARQAVARALQVRPERVLFTGGGTEGNNIAISGVLATRHDAGYPYEEMEVITTAIEHPSVAKTVAALAKRGVKVRYVPVDETGQVVVSEFAAMLTERTVLVSLAYANSEIGTIQPITAIRRSIRDAEQRFGNHIVLHIDAAQAPLWLSCQFDSLGADLLVLDAAKCQGPKGAGVLVCHPRIKLAPVLHGGGQEQGMRPGTENVANIVGTGVAIADAQADWRKRQEAVTSVRDAGIELLLDTVPGAVLNGAAGEKRLANNINISIPGLDTEYATVVLDTNGIAVSTRSACSGADGGESAVVKEITDDTARATSTLRLSLGPDTTVSQLERVAKILHTHSTRMARLTP